MDSLKHYGVKGMHWGVRRYQNYDGTRIGAKRRQSGGGFLDDEKAVDYAARKMKNKDYSKSKNRAEEIFNDWSKFKKEYKYKELTNKIYKEAVKREPQITSDVSDSINKNGGTIHGLENRIKTESSINRKLQSKEVKDAIRYTAILSDKDFVKEYNGIKSDLNKKGYKETRCKNYFEEYKKGNVTHKSVQTNYQTKDGYTFEIQFQTKSSQKVKDKKVPLYEEVRNPNTSSKRKGEIIVQMALLADGIKDPDNINEIKSY